MTEERTGEAFELGERLTVVGRKLLVGEPAPAFSLDRFNPATQAIEPVRLADSTGHVRLLNVVNSIDTPVCQVETRCWEKQRIEWPAGVVLFTISMDLPFALARWMAAENVNHAALSAHRSEEFGRDYGVLLKEWRLLQRAVFVIDGKERIIHAEYVADQMKEPDYVKAQEAVRKAMGK